jgi:hypothetical protein
MNKLAFTLPEAAEIAGTSVSVLRRKIANNDLTARYIDTKPVILASELESWLNALPTEAK